ncbi:MAG: S8 family serine peptidase [Clostridia bacterium]|nr:S8 family serine peptidase [Clostridia bacterium]
MNYKKFISFFLVLNIFLNSFSFVCYSENADISIKEFNRQLSDMVVKYDGMQTSSVSSNLPINRLIVKTDYNEKMEENYGAIDSVEGYKCLHIFQYETLEKTNKAYSSFFDDDIEYVIYDKYIELAENSLSDSINTVTDEHLSWNSDVAQVDDAFNLIKEKGLTCEEILVAVLDTGIYAEHEFFDSSRLIDSGYYRTDEETGISYPSLIDDLNHGTHVSGIIYDNTMPNIKLAPYRVFPLIGMAELSVIFGAFEQAVFDDVDIINMSIGSTFSDEIINENRLFIESIEEATSEGIVVIAAAGNKKANADKVLPGLAPDAITVAATDKLNAPDISYSASGNCVDIAAPGTKINSTVPRLWNWYEHDIDEEKIYDPNPQSLYKEMTGTSMATPLVTAAAATLKSISPDMSAAEIQRIIKENAYVPEGWDTKYGTGIVNFYNMVKQDVSGKPTIKLNSDGKIEITAPEGTDSRLYYTLDGSIPTIDNHIVYTEPFSISGKNVRMITAVCHENGKLIGEAAKYRTNSFHTLELDYKETVKPINTEAKWYSWNTDVATVDREGNITAVGVGKTTVTAILDSGRRITYNVHVEYTSWQWFIRIFLFGFIWY